MTKFDEAVKEIAQVNKGLNALLRDCDRAIKWSNRKRKTGFSDPWRSGYEKAYQQVKRDLEIILEPEEQP